MIEVRRPRAPQLEVERVRSRLAAKLYGVDSAPPKIDHYEVVERIGFGTQGDVYLVHDPRLDRRLAIKVLRRDVGDEGVAEARALAQVVHPNVVPVFDVGVLPADGPDAARAYLVMEYVAGRSLQAWCESTTSWIDRLRVLVDAGRGLQAAHAAGLVHGDFKPSNVVVGDDGRPRVMDFGLARWAADATTAESTGSYRGTPGYRAPECDEHGADARSDQYSFCVTARRMLVEATTMPPPGIAERLSAVLDRGLRTTPADRWPDMATLLASLADAGRRRMLVAPLAIAGALVLVGGVLVAGEAKPARLVASASLDARGPIAAALVRAGHAATRADHDDEARALLERAIYLAEASGDDRVTADAALMLVDLLGRRRGQFEAARRWEPHARSAIVRLGDPELAARLDLRWGTILGLAGDADAGREVLLDLHDRLTQGPMTLVHTADVESALARLEVDANHSKEALAWAERAVDSQAARGETAHAAYAEALLRLGVAQEQRDDLVAARKSFETVLAIHERAGEHTLAIGARNSLAVVLERQGELDRAATEYERVLRAATELRMDGFVVATRANLALLELARKHPDAALEHVTIARTVAEDFYPAGHAIFAAIHGTHSDALRATGALDRAVTAAEQALSIAVARGMELGEIGRHRWRVGEVRWLAGGARTQARAEVAQACVELGIDPTVHADDLADCKAWLAAHPR